MRLLSCLVLSTTLVTNSCFAEVVERQVLAEESSNGDVYLSAEVAAFSSYTVSTRSSAQPTPRCDSSLAISINTTGGLTFPTSQTFQGSLRRPGAAERTRFAVDTHTTLTSIRSRSRSESNRSSTSSKTGRWGILSSHASQGSQSATSQTSSAPRNEVISADTASTFASITLATLSTGSEPFLVTSGLISSEERVLTQLLLFMPSSSKSPSAGVSAYSAVASGNGSSTTKLGTSSVWYPISKNAHSLPTVTSVPGSNSTITTSQRESKSSHTPSRAEASASTVALPKNKDPLATSGASTSTKATITPIINL